MVWLFGCAGFAGELLSYLFELMFSLAVKVVWFWLSCFVLVLLFSVGLLILSCLLCLNYCHLVFVVFLFWAA